MPFCPKCRYEYKEGIATCPDCEEALVAALPMAEEDSADEEIVYEDWIPIARLTSHDLAEMLEEGLRAEKIPAVVLSSTGHFGQLGQLGVTAFRPVGGAFSLMVPREYATAADRAAAVILGDQWEKVKLVDIDT